MSARSGQCSMCGQCGVPMLVIGWQIRVGGAAVGPEPKVDRDGGDAEYGCTSCEGGPCNRRHPHDCAPRAVRRLGAAERCLLADFGPHHRRARLYMMRSIDASDPLRIAYL